MIDNLNISIFADGADIGTMLELNEKRYIKGFTTNPTLLMQAGVRDYLKFAESAAKAFPDKPLSLEVISDEGKQMEEEARILAGLGKNIMVKIPIVNSRGQSTVESIKKLSDEGLNLNITAVFTLQQVREAADALNRNTVNYISVFAGRIADTGRDACETVREAVKICKDYSGISILWASCREIYNIIEADNCGCQIITVTSNLIKKLECLGKDLEQFSVETAKMFYRDARSSGLKIL